jgi:hypothetical protein
MKKNKLTRKDKKFLKKWTPREIWSTGNSDALAFKSHCGGIYAIKAPDSGLIKCGNCGEIFEPDELGDLDKSEVLNSIWRNIRNRY